MRMVAADDPGAALAGCPMRFDQGFGIKLEVARWIIRDIAAALVILNVQGVTEQKATHLALAVLLGFGNDRIEHFA